MATTSFTSREFNHDVGRAKKAAVVARKIQDFQGTGAVLTDP